MDIRQLHRLFLGCSAITTDSRAIKGGEMFVALKGENFDGNDYALKAIEAGASYAVVDKTSVAAGEGAVNIIPVEDTLETLQALGRFHRENTFVDGKRLTVIGLTGTNGKTTTKELIRCVLAKKYSVTATEGNLNNDIGVPLSLLKINSETQIAVIEMGANHPDDIARLVKVSEPDYGLITNVGKAHLLGFGSYDGVKKAKGQLYDYISSSGTAIFLNADDPVLCEMAEARKGLRTIEYGVKCDGAEILPSDVGSPYLRMSLPAGENGSGLLLNTNLVGRYNADNVMGAIAVGRKFGISTTEAIEAISAYIPSNNRSQMMKTERNTLIIDAYNANPTSMAAALDNFENISGGDKAVLLGDMRELGDDSVQEHRNILAKLKAADINEIFLVGEEFGKAIDIDGSADNISWFISSDRLAEYLKNNKLENRTILIKGSRGIMMEKTLREL